MKLIEGSIGGISATTVTVNGKTIFIPVAKRAEFQALACELNEVVKVFYDTNGNLVTVERTTPVVPKPVPVPVVPVPVPVTPADTPMHMHMGNKANPESRIQPSPSDNEDELKMYLEDEYLTTTEEVIFEMDYLYRFFKRVRKSADVIPEWKQRNPLERRVLVKAMERLIKLKHVE